jgi:hypothetical protein
MTFIYVVLTLLIVASTALPDSAFVCQLGGSSDTRQNSIEKGGYQVTLNGVTLKRDILDPGFYNIFLHGVVLSLTIQSSVGQYQNDIVVIASGGDIRNVDSLDTRTPQALTNSTPNTMEFSGCSNYAVSSQTSTDNSTKDLTTMAFQWPSNGQVLYLDVNVVRYNNNTNGSQYFYTQYPMFASNSTTFGEKICKRCGLFQRNTVCPLVQCGFIIRLLGLCDVVYGCRD